MFCLWQSQHHQQVDEAKTGWSERWIYAVRTHPVYLIVLQYLKWHIVPFVFGMSILLGLPALAVYAIVWGLP